MNDQINDSIPILHCQISPGLANHGKGEIWQILQTEFRKVQPIIFIRLIIKEHPS